MEVLLDDAIGLPEGSALEEVGVPMSRNRGETWALGFATLLMERSRYYEISRVRTGDVDQSQGRTIRRYLDGEVETACGSARQIGCSASICA